MEALHEKISGHIRFNTNGDPFITGEAWRDVISSELVMDILSSSSIKGPNIEELCHAIISRAKTTFSILTLISKPEAILKFFAADQLQQAPIDRRLPLSFNELQTLFGDVQSAFTFYTKQWQFVAPVFNSTLLPRVLDNETILPILESKDAGEGGFGVAQLIRVEASHQHFSSSGDVWVVRKELKPTRFSKSDYELELQNLSILRLLKHPCTVELLTCFAYRGRYNLIFTYADNGSVENVLSGDHPSPFQQTAELYLAICGLCSAAAAVHNFLTPSLEAIGCHHDIKPSNILIYGQRLVLADFGLSRFKEPVQDSASYFRGGQGDYLAPECEDLVYDFKKHQVRRSSDVWSLGCVFLEYLVYEVEGAAGVKIFRQSRSYKKENATYHRFHEGPFQMNREVLVKLESLQSHDEPHIREVVNALIEVLSLVPGDRPGTATFCHLMRRALVNLLLSQIQDAYTLTKNNPKTLTMKIEHCRLSGWASAFKQSMHNRPSLSGVIFDARNFEHFDVLAGTLVELRTVLQSQPEDPSAQNSLPIRKAIDMLYEASPSMLKQCALDLFQASALLIPRVAEAQTLLPEDSDVGWLAKVKNLNDQLQSGAIPDVTMPPFPYLDINPSRVEAHYMTGHHNASQVLVETKPLHDYHLVGDFRLTLSRRMNAVASLLNAGHNLQVLRCKGCFINDALEMGLVYAFPNEVKHSETGKLQQQNASLYDILSSDPKGKMRPLLGDRFSSAHGLASSVFHFHRLNWIQRGICSQNIRFFRPKGASWKAHMKTPYFVGFLHSREVAINAFSEGHWKPQMEKGYQHPAYISSFKGFLPHFDYYSLGIVLIELGLWSPLKIFAREFPETKRSSEDFIFFLLNTVLPGLGQKMGHLYQSAVHKCLTWTPLEPVVEGTCSPAENLRFKEAVVDVLSCCRA